MPASVTAASPAATRAEQRRRRVEDGLQELDRWLADQVRTGLAGLPKLGYPHFDAIAARMVDAQAPGVAGILRGIPNDLAAADWPERVLHEFAGLHLLSRAHAGIDDLPADLAATVRSRIGYSTAKADVLAGPGRADSWWAVGAVDVTDQQLRRRRVWLHGVTTGLTGVWLTFAPPGMSFDDSILPGLGVSATLHAYPGAGQPRMLLGESSEAPPAPLRWAGQTVAQTRARFADLVAADPWTARMGTAVRGEPVRDEQGLVVARHRGGVLPAARAERAALAAAGPVRRRAADSVRRVECGRADAAQRAPRRSRPSIQYGHLRMNDWPDLLTTALLGTGRRPLPAWLPEGWGTGLPVDSGQVDPALRVLDLAARHRAVRPGQPGAVRRTGCRPTKPAPPADRPSPPDAADRGLGRTPDPGPIRT